MLIGASLRRTTAVCLKPPDIESRFELALGRVVVAIGTVLSAGRRWLHVLLVIDTFSYLAGFGQIWFLLFCHIETLLACQAYIDRFSIAALTSDSDTTAFRSL